MDELNPCFILLVKPFHPKTLSIDSLGLKIHRDHFCACFEAFSIFWLGLGQKDSG